MKAEKFFKISISSALILIILIGLFGCGGGGGGGGGRLISATNGDWGADAGNLTGGYFEVSDNKIYNFMLTMDSPVTDGSCAYIRSCVVIRPGETEPYMEFAGTDTEEEFQKIIYYGPIDIKNDGSILIEEEFSIPLFCVQKFTISGKFGSSDSISGSWEYTIDDISTTGSWYGYLMTMDEENVSSYSLLEKTIVIDGEIADWEGISPAIIDPKGDEDPESDFDGTDINSVYLAKDSNFLYFLITMHDGDPPVDKNLIYMIYFNTYPGGGMSGDRIAQAFLNPPPGGSMLVDVTETALSLSDWKSIAKYSSDHIAVGTKILEFKVALNDIGDIDDKHIWVSLGMLGTQDGDSESSYPLSDTTNEQIRIEYP